MTKILLILAIGFGFFAIFFLNWFWRLLAIPVIAIFAYDVINQWMDKKRGKEQ